MIVVSSSIRALVAMAGALALAGVLVAPQPAEAQQMQPVEAPPCTAAVPPAAQLEDRGDIPDVHRNAVDCAAFYGVTLGVPTGDGFAYQPEAAVTRAAMASFLARAIVAAGYQLPSPAEGQFTDVAGSVHQDAIERLHAAGVVLGRTADTFAPARSVTRAQAASMLLRSVAYVRGVELETLLGGDTPFTDIDGSAHRDAIAGLWNTGLVQGLTPTGYGPAREITRAQMASVLTRLMNAEALPASACTNDADDYTVFPPADWATNDGAILPVCSVFDPDPFELEPGIEIPTDLAVVVRSEPVAFNDVVDPDLDEVVEAVSLTIDGREAVRQEVVASGTGLYPEGQRRLMFAVDRGDTTLVAATHDVAGTDFQRNAAVLSRMVLSLDLDGSALGPFLPADSVLTEPAEGAGLGLENVRLGTHDGFDRVVFDLAGDGTPGWSGVRYDDEPVRQGSGFPVETEGGATLTLLLDGMGLPNEAGVPQYDGPERLQGPGTAVEEVLVGGWFEGHIDVFIGTSGEQPFRVFRLTNPDRVVVDVAHG